MKAKPKTVRDFVYLDWERVRSIAAQLLEGVPEGKSTEKAHEMGTHAEAEAGLFGIMKSKGGGDYRYFSTENETRSFHHYVYSLVEEELKKASFVTVIDPTLDAAKWTPHLFTDGQFVLASGTVRFMDFAWICSMLDSFPKMMETVQHYESINIEGMRASGMITQQDAATKRQEQQRQLKQIKGFKIAEMTSLIKQLHGDIVRVKILPNTQHKKNVFVGTANSRCFQDPPSSLSQRHGFEAKGSWNALIQINLSSDAVPTALPIGNQIEDAIEGMAFALDNVCKTAFSPKFPAISFTPISIYRLCAKPELKEQET